MLLRSSSTPILNSWLPHSKDSSPEPEFQLHQITKSISFTSSFHSELDDYSSKKVISTQTFQESNKNRSPVKKQCKNNSVVDENKESKQPSSRIERLFSSSGLGDHHDNEESFGLQTLVVGGGVGGGGGGCGCRGGGDGGSEFSKNNNITDAYYQKMISADPGNPLLLGNYAKFLKEVRGDFVKAEEFYGRAILANPNDGNMLSLYGDLVWEKDKDAQRAETYFDQAVKTAPEDCYVLASYARFLWDAEEEGNEESEDEHIHPSFFNGQPRHPPLAAAS